MPLSRNGLRDTIAKFAENKPALTVVAVVLHSKSYDMFRSIVHPNFSKIQIANYLMIFLY